MACARGGCFWHDIHAPPLTFHVSSPLRFDYSCKLLSACCISDLAAAPLQPGCYLHGGTDLEVHTHYNRICAMQTWFALALRLAVFLTLGTGLAWHRISRPGRLIAHDLDLRSRLRYTVGLSYTT